MSTPRKLTVKKPVKLIFCGGFLGSGKTTALAALAKRLIQRGMRVGFITNDQSENLVDTIIVRQMLTDLGVPVEQLVDLPHAAELARLKASVGNQDLAPIDSALQAIDASFDRLRVEYSGGVIRRVMFCGHRLIHDAHAHL